MNSLTAEDVMRQALTIMDGFAVKANQHDGASICICDACSVVMDLKLRDFLHAGDASIRKVVQFVKVRARTLFLPTIL